MAITEGSNINFYKGTKEKLLSNLAEMSDGDLAIATDEMQWYMVKIINNEKSLVGIGINNNSE